VIRECGQPVPPCPNTTLAQLRYDAAAAERGSPPWLSGIQAALSAAAGALLAHMAGPQGRLLSWLYCLKHVFLLDQVGDNTQHCLSGLHLCRVWTAVGVPAVDQIFLVVFHQSSHNLLVVPTANALKPCLLHVFKCSTGLACWLSQSRCVSSCASSACEYGSPKQPLLVQLTFSPVMCVHLVSHCRCQGDFLVHLMEQGDAESSAPLSSLAPYQLQGLLDAALRSSSVAASPHIGVITDGVLSIKVDKRTIVQLLMAAAQQTQQVCVGGGLAADTTCHCCPCCCC